MTSKGQVTIPLAVRQRLGLRPGDVLEFAEEKGEYHLRKTGGGSRFAAYEGYLQELAGHDPDELLEDVRDR